ncbi:MAG: ATPase, T2SS/T4P/T4SS family, partial [bacterium]
MDSLNNVSLNQFTAILNAGRKGNASDIHLVANLPPVYRINGDIITSEWEPLSRLDLKNLTEKILTEEQLALFKKEKELCISYYHEKNGRIRISFYYRIGTPELSIRLCNLEIQTRKKLGLPEILEVLGKKTSGLIVITGPTGMGKTTTLNYLIDFINSSRRSKIVSIEDPVEFEHTNKRSIVVQLEIGTDALSFSKCLRHTLRLDPDVICIGEMRDKETIETALIAAETGHLVITTLHTPSSYGALDRIISVFGGDRQSQVGVQLSTVLHGVIAQRLV